MPESDNTKPKVSLREQADEAQRELARRHRAYPGLVKHGKMTAAEKEVGIARMRAIRDTLRLFAEHESAVRITLGQALRASALAREADELRAETVVAAVLDAFPDAVITDINPLTQPQGAA